jgi:hypothetical protein
LAYYFLAEADFCRKMIGVSARMSKAIERIRSAIAKIHSVSLLGYCGGRFGGILLGTEIVGFPVRMIGLISPSMMFLLFVVCFKEKLVSANFAFHTFRMT